MNSVHTWMMIKKRERAAEKRRERDLKAKRREILRQEVLDRRARRAESRLHRLSMKKSKRTTGSRVPRSATNEIIKNLPETVVTDFSNGVFTYSTTDVPTLVSQDVLNRYGGENSPRPYKTWRSYGLERTKWTQTGVQSFVTGKRSWSQNVTTPLGVRTYWYQSGFSSTYVGSMPFTFSSGSQSDKTSENLALEKLVKSLSVRRNAEWNAAVTIGESRDTFRLFAETARRLTDMYRGVRRGDLSSLKRAISNNNLSQYSFRNGFYRRRGKVLTPEEIFLQYNLAWKPLLGDVDAAANYLAKRLIAKRPDSVIILRSRAATQRSRELKVQVGTGVYDYRQITTEQSSSICVKVRPKFKSEPNAIEQCGFTDPWSLAWELLPLSFVVDYFVNVGTVLSSMHEMSYWSFEDALLSSRTTIRETIVRSGSYQSFNGDQVVVLGRAEGVKTSAGRGPFVVPTAASLRFNKRFDSQGVEKPWSTVMVGNVVSLLSLAFLRK